MVEYGLQVLENLHLEVNGLQHRRQKQRTPRVVNVRVYRRPKEFGLARLQGYLFHGLFAGTVSLPCVLLAPPTSSELFAGLLGEYQQHQSCPGIPQLLSPSLPAGRHWHEAGR